MLLEIKILRACQGTFIIIVLVDIVSCIRACYVTYGRVLTKKWDAIWEMPMHLKNM